MTVRNIAAFTEAMGVQAAALIWYLSTRVMWRMTITETILLGPNQARPTVAHWSKG